MSFFKFFLEANGPVFLTVFGLLSVGSVAVIVWRIWLNVNARSDLSTFVEELRSALAQDRDTAIVCCEQQPGVIPKVFLSALMTCPQGKVATRNEVHYQIEWHILPELNFLLPYMQAGVKIAPMIGLLGTVVGMIRAFGKIAGATKVDPSALSGNIGMALFTTAEGLVIAIVLLLAHTLFREVVKKFRGDLQYAAVTAERMLPEMLEAREAASLR